MAVAVGTYAGAGGAGNRAITDTALLNRIPSVVLLEELSDAGGVPDSHRSDRGRCKTNTMAVSEFGAVLGVPDTGEPGAGDASFGFEGVTTGIVSLDAGGFTVSSNWDQSGVHYAYVCFTLDPGEIATGTYAGDGAGTRTITLPFVAEVVMLFIQQEAAGSNHSVWSTRHATDDNRIGTFNGSVSTTPARVQLNDLESFTVTTEFNALGENYHWVAFSRGPYVVNQIAMKRYTGDGADGRTLGGAVAGSGFTAEAVMIFEAAGPVQVAMDSGRDGAGVLNHSSAEETFAFTEDNAVSLRSSPNSVNTEEGVRSFDAGGMTVDAGATTDPNVSTRANTAMYFLTGQKFQGSGGLTLRMSHPNNVGEDLRMGV